jgi:DNA-binding response OmpR family regulator
LQLVEDIQPKLVLLDLMMPDMDGWEVYQRLKANPNTRHIPVIVLTARAQSIDKVLGLHIAKVDDYITKPFGPQELSKSVKKIIAEKR